MKYLVPILLMVSCMEIEPQYRVDSRVSQYVEAFYHEAELHSRQLERHNLVVSIEPVDAAARSIYQDGQLIILISPDTYEFFTSGKWVRGDSAYYGMENIMFHELGHALLRRKHCDPCESIMASGVSYFEYAKDMGKRQKLLNELFR